MSTCLAVGIPHDAGWARIALEQTGVPALAIESLREGLDAGLRCFIWSGADSLLRDSLLTAERPFAVITDHGTLAALSGYQSTETRSSLFRGPCPAGRERSFRIDAPVGRLDALDTEGSCGDAQGRPLTGSGVRRERRGAVHLTSLPWDVTRLQLGAGSSYREHWSHSTSRHFVEVGPPFDSGALRRLLFENVRRAFSDLELPLVRFSPFLAGRRHFGVRIDADGYSRESTDAVLRIARRINASFTWFIHVEGWQHNLGEIRRLVDAGQDVQLHCWRHLTYESRRTNAANLWAGRRVLAQHGAWADAVVSPLGFCFPGFADAVRDLGFQYSSEFGAAVDDLPFRPEPNRPLQVPVHCGSIGVLEPAGFSADEMWTHLETAILEQADGDGMGILYDHPLDRMERFEESFATMFQSWIDRGYSYLGMGSYAAAWARRACPTELWLDDRRVHLQGDPAGGGFGYEIYQPAGEERFLPHGFEARPGTFDTRLDRYHPPSDQVMERVAVRDKKYAMHVKQSVASWYATHFAQRLRTRAGALRRSLRRMAGL